MIEIVLLEIISITSFIIAILSNLLEITTLDNYFLIFIWSVLSSGVYAIKHDKKTNRLILLLQLAPLLVFKGLTAIFFFIGLFILLYFYLTRSLGVGNYNNQVDSFKKFMCLMAGLLIFSYLNETLNKFTQITLPFLIIYLLSTLILIRNLRHINLNLDINLIRRSNRKYLVFIIGVSSLITMDNLRNNLFDIITNTFNIIYTFILNVLFKIIYYPITWILWIIERFINWILSRVSERIDEAQEFQIDLGEGEEVIVEFITKEAPIINNSLKIIFILITIYLIYRLIKKAGDMKVSNNNYVEEREFISKQKDKKQKRYIKRKPNDLNGQIRYYYERYLIRLKRSNMDVSEFDTSEEINKIARDRYPTKVIDKFRNIYIKYRYGFKEEDTNDIREMESLYREMKNQD